MTPLEKERALALSGCRFTPASFDKRFARNMGGMVKAGGEQITEAEAACLERKCWRYRRQLPANLVPASQPADNFCRTHP
jgi:hypothetical protein